MKLIFNAQLSKIMFTTPPWHQRKQRNSQIFFFFFCQKVQKEYINPKSPILLQYHIKFVAWYLLIESLSRKLRAKKVG